MSSSTSKVFLCLRWLCLLCILCINTPSCQGLERLCGHKLSDALDLICVNGFARKTRKSIDPLDYVADTEDETPMPFDTFLSELSHNTNAMTKTRRRRHGVYDECCRKSCTFSELRSYCL